jgi:hypothetical protein
MREYGKLLEAMKDAAKRQAVPEDNEDKAVITEETLDHVAQKAVQKHSEFLVNVLSRTGTDNEDEATEELDEYSHRVGKAYSDGPEMFDNPCPHCGRHIPLERPAESFMESLAQKLNDVYGEFEAIGKALEAVLIKQNELDAKFDERTAEQTAYLVEKAMAIQPSITPRFGTSPQETENLMSGLRNQRFVGSNSQVSDTAIAKAIDTYTGDELLEITTKACKTPTEKEQCEYVIDSLTIAGSRTEQISLMKSLPPSALAEITKGGK